MQVSFRTWLVGVTVVAAVSTPAWARQSAADPASSQSQAPQTPPATQKPAPKPADQPPPAQQPPAQHETVVVSASKTPQPLVDAPATMTVIDSKTLENSPTTSYADVLRTVPGVNVSQTSARDINITSRGATSSLATSELAVVDGRSVYQDFFGFVMWDFMPVNFDEIKQIEVIRGPASAVWGANALNGVVNVITKSPREMQGGSVVFGAGEFDRTVGAASMPRGSLFYTNANWADVVNDRLSYKISGGYYTQDPLPRPTGLIPNGTGTSYPSFTNSGTQQPKFDGRMDYDLADGRAVSISGGYSGTSGIIETGIGPFDIKSGSAMGYGKFNFTRKAFSFQAFSNILNGDAANLVSVGADGNPITFSFRTRNFDTEVGNTTSVGKKQVLTYGGNFRYNHFNLTIAPGQTHRSEGGGYVQDDMFLTDQARLVAGARVDKFSSIANAVFSPRVALILKPKPMQDQSIRVSFNRAFRAPSMINNNLSTTIASPFPLGAISPVFGSQEFLIPTSVTGNANLKEERLDAYEVSYTGEIAKRTTVSAAVYYNRLSQEILFTVDSLWPITTPPPGWQAGPLAWAAVQTSLQVPMAYTYKNLGTEKNKGLELGADSRINDKLSVSANYSFQAQPVPAFPGYTPAQALAEVNLPAKHRGNFSLSYSDDRWAASGTVSSSASAFWQDVLDARYHGTTSAYTTVNVSATAKVNHGKAALTLRVTNLFNQDVMQHIFGDVLKRQIVAELKINLPKK